MSEHALEFLNTAWRGYVLAEALVRAGNLTSASVIALCASQSRLIDACVACGMPYDGDENEFAAQIITAWLVGA